MPRHTLSNEISDVCSQGANIRVTNLAQHPGQRDWHLSNTS